ncbi:hypothetical protein E3N86_08695 [Cryobacterium sp. Hz7]|uniref:Uncharacterized protein n=1 Tax=Cryobacterium sandaracinum TaxID=1259247 RepID=A0ABY2JDQ2_9MICO|nr:MULTISPECIES: hypothetical protein [Cryobacterium]TFB60834.1 hypothetical protein E3N86_08695 [Cryobacterium sp. Hz7]TFC66563.1 hypothetical protein E3O54_10095 [Cryobacterium sp. TMT2-4]TFD03275.1 hypothetical protein E3T25_06530 [Cryobacterium sandaracinum]
MTATGSLGVEQVEIGVAHQAGYCRVVRKQCDANRYRGQSVAPMDAQFGADSSGDARGQVLVWLGRPHAVLPSTLTFHPWQSCNSGQEQMPHRAGRPSAHFR